jgi:ferredoxin-nitrite reductase
VTTRANLQIREITAQPCHRPVACVQALGLTSRGSGADNIRNITGQPDRRHRPAGTLRSRGRSASDMHHYILNHREMYGLPRKFNIAFDGGGQVPDAGGHQRHRLRRRGTAALDRCTSVCSSAASPAIATFAHETGVLLKPEECVKVAGAVVRAFIAHGDRTNRAKARLKYVLDRMGRERSCRRSRRSTARRCAAPRASRSRRGRWPTSTAISACIRRSRPVSTISASCCRSAASPEQMRGLAEIASASAAAPCASRCGRTC